MDYPFFCRSIAQLPDDLMLRLVAEVTDKSTEVHPSFARAKLVQKQIEAISDNLIAEVLQSIPYVPAESYVDQSINVIAPNTAVNEHEDGWKPGYAQGVVHTHCVHVPLITNPGALMFHRRDAQAVFQKQHLEYGKVYLYNNYVRHAIVNSGQTTRVHLILYFLDPKWKIKEVLLQALGYRPDQYYEA